MIEPFLYQNNAEAQEACDKWQSRLRLFDWRIQCEMVHPERMPGADARTTLDWGRKIAYLRLMEPGTYSDRDRMTPIDHELNLVHELLHLWIDWPFDALGMEKELDKSYTFREQSIEQLAIAFVNCWRPQ